MNSVEPQVVDRSPEAPEPEAFPLILGLDTFGDRTHDKDDRPESHAQTIRNVVEQGVLADQVGVDFFGIGEHHTEDFPMPAADVALGAIAARSPAEVADAAETVMASLPTPDVVLNVATGPGGVIEGKRVRRFVDLSTTGAVMAQRIFDMLRARNIVQVDSPVSGGVRGAEKGTLAVMISGPGADVAAVEPALKVIGKIFVLGERPGLGQTMKLVNNVLSAAAWRQRRKRW